MAAPKLKKAQELTIGEVAKQIHGLRTSLPHNPNKRELHMLTTAYAGLKFLVLNGQSDVVRLQACKTILGLPIVQARLKYMLEVEGLLLHHQQSEDMSKQLSELLVGTDPAAIRALEHAESQIIPAKPKKTKETT